MKKLIATIAMTAFLPILGHAACNQLVPRDGSSPLSDPTLFACKATVKGASSNDEGYRLSKEAALADVKSYPYVRSCRQIGIDQTSHAFSFCDPESQCSNFNTILYFGCGPGDATSSDDDAFQECIKGCHDGTDGGIETAVCVRDCRIPTLIRPLLKH